MRPSGSSSRPPSGQRAFGLNGGDLGRRQFVVHGDLAHPWITVGRFHPRDRRARVPSGLTPRRQRPIPPFGQLGHQRHSLPGRRHPTVRHATNTPPPPSCAGRNSRFGPASTPEGRRAPAMGRAQKRPPRASALYQSSFPGNLRLRFNYRSQMSQLTVTHPSAMRQTGAPNFLQKWKDKYVEVGFTPRPVANISAPV